MSKFALCGELVMPPTMAADPYERFTRLFLQYEPEILRAVMMFVPSRADARDIVQETAVTLWQQFDQYDASRPFANWAIGFALIQVRRWFRNVEREGKFSEKAVEALLIADDERADDKEKRDAALRECLDAMPQNSREIIEGYYFAERGVDALAATHGRTVEAIYKTLQRLRAGLLDCIHHKITLARS